MGEVTHRGMALPNIGPGVYNVTLVLCSKTDEKCAPDCSCGSNPYKAAATLWSVIAPVDFSERNPMMIADNFDDLTMECRWWSLQEERDPTSPCSKVVQYSVDTHNEF